MNQKTLKACMLVAAIATLSCGKLYSQGSVNHSPLLNPNRSLDRLFNLFTFFFRSVYAISAFLPASWSHPCLDVARYAFANDVTNLLGTNTNLT